MNEKTSASSKKRKTLSAALAVIMAFVMLLSGTLAYFYQTRAVNTIKGEEQQKLVVGHDDFVKTTRLPNGAVEYNKDVYVENIGDTPVFVRVRLTEELTIGDDTIEAVHIPDSSATLGVGTTEHDTEATGDLHDYFKLNFGNTGNTTRNTYLSANAKAYTDGRLEGVETVDGVAKDSSNTAYSKTDADGNPIADKDIYDNIKSLYYGEVITMEDFFDENKTDGWRQNHSACWIIDNSPEDTVTFTDAEGNEVSKQVSGGGWAYWSKMLKPGEQTTVLLNSVIVDSKIAGTEYTYNINVDFESVDETDKGVWLTGQTTANDGQTTGIRSDLASNDARKLLTWAADTTLGAYTPESAALAIEIKQAQKEAKSEVAKDLYNTAMSNLNDSDQEYAYQMADMYKKMAEETERLKASNDETLDDQVIVVNETGEVTDKPTEMQDAVAKAIIKTADRDKNGTLTVEEALGLTSLYLNDSEITSLSGLMVKSDSPFRHLRSLSVVGSNLSSFDGTNFSYIENGETKGLTYLQFSNDYSFSGTINVTPLKDTLKNFVLWMVYGVTDITGLDQLKNLRSLQLTRVSKSTGYESVRYAFTAEELNTLFDAEHSGRTLRTVAIVAEVLVEGQTSLTKSPLILPQGLNTLAICIYNMAANGVYELEGFPNLKRLESLNYGTPVEFVIKEGSCPSLQSVYTNMPNMVTFTNLPNGIGN